MGSSQISCKAQVSVCKELCYIHPTQNRDPTTQRANHVYSLTQWLYNFDFMCCCFIKKIKLFKQKTDCSNVAAIPPI